MLLKRLRGKKSQDPLADPPNRLQKTKRDLACRLLARFKGFGGSSSMSKPSSRPVFHLSGSNEDRLINSDLLRSIPPAQSATYPPFSLLGDTQEFPTSDASPFPRAISISGPEGFPDSMFELELELELQAIMSAPVPESITSAIASTGVSEELSFHDQLDDTDLMQTTEMSEMFAQESDLMLNDDSMEVSFETANMALNDGSTETPPLSSPPAAGLQNSKVFYESIAYPIMLEDVKMGACNAQSFEDLFAFIRAAAAGDVPRLELEFGYALKYLLVSRFPIEAFRALEPYQEAISAFVRLLHNAAVLDLAVEPELLEAVDWVLRSGTSEAKENAVILILEVSTWDRDRFILALSFFPHTIVSSIVGILLSRPSPSLSRLALKALLSLCISPENRAAAIEAGAVAAFALVIPRENNFELTSAMVETCLTILTFLATTPEGLSAMREHETFLLVLVDVILRVSDGVTDCAIGILCKLCTPSCDADHEAVRTQERVVQAGARNRLLLVLQCEGSRQSKAGAQDLLKLLLRFWLRGDRSVRSIDRTTVEFFRM